MATTTATQDIYGTTEAGVYSDIAVSVNPTRIIRVSFLNAKLKPASACGHTSTAKFSVKWRKRSISGPGSYFALRRSTQQSALKMESECATRRITIAQIAASEENRALSWACSTRRTSAMLVA